MGRFLVFLFIFVWIGDAAAQDANQSPRSLDRVVNVTALDVRQLVSGGAVLVDTRSIHDYLAGRIPGAIHVVYREYSQRQVDYDPAEDGLQPFLARLGRFVPPDRAVIFYCNGPLCWKSYKASKAAVDAGYRHVFWLRGGLGEWQEAGFHVERD